MKKMFIFLLCAALLTVSAACAKRYEPSPAPLPELFDEDLQVGEADADGDELPETLSGGWQAAEDPTLTDAQKAIFEKALKELVGVNYTPIACLGTQVVAGTNYCFLTQATVVYPGAEPGFKLVYVYADLAGGAEVMNIADLPIIPNDDGTLSAPTEQLMGGWTYAAEYEITDELRALLDKATEDMVGAGYTAVAEIGTQVVAGLNHCLLCRITPVVPDPVSHYALVYIYANLEGGAELLQVIDFDFGAYCTYGA